MLKEKIKCKLGFHTTDWQNCDLGYYHCWCGKHILNEDYPATWRSDEIEKMYEKDNLKP